MKNKCTDILLTLFSLFLKNEAIKTGNVVKDSFYVFLLNLKSRLLAVCNQTFPICNIIMPCHYRAYKLNVWISKTEPAISYWKKAKYLCYESQCIPPVNSISKWH